MSSFFDFVVGASIERVNYTTFSRLASQPASQSDCQNSRGSSKCERDKCHLFGFHCCCCCAGQLSWLCLHLGRTDRRKEPQKNWLLQFIAFIFCCCVVLVLLGILLFLVIRLCRSNSIQFNSADCLTVWLSGWLILIWLVTDDEVQKAVWLCSCFLVFVVWFLCIIQLTTWTRRNFCRSCRR